MFNMFGNGIHKAVTVAQFTQMPRRDQDSVLQDIYDQGYSVPEISRFFNISPQTIYSRINAHRGRGPQLQSQ